MKHNQTIFSLIGFAFFLFLGIQIVTVTVITLIIQRVSPSIMTASWYTWAISYIPLYGVAFPTMYAFMKKIPDSPFTPEQNKPSGEIMAALSLVCLSIMFLFAIITSVITTLISLLTHSTLTNSLETAISGSNVFLNFLVIGIIAPIMEEIVFRGLTYKKLGAYGSKTYVLTSALIFALFHTNIYQFIYTFLLGIIFAFITYKTGTIKYSTILHLIVNLSASGGLSLVVNYLGILPLTTLYGIMVLAAIIGGIVIFVIGGIRYKSKLHFEAGPLSPPKVRQVIFNPGMWLFILLTLVITIQNMFM